MKDNKSLLEEIDKKFNMLQQEKAQLENRISDITVEMFRLQGEVRILNRWEAEEKAEKTIPSKKKN